jgi:hypothetical protein
LRNELIKKEIRQNARQCRAFFVIGSLHRWLHAEIPADPVVSLAASAPHVKRTVHSSETVRIRGQVASVSDFRAALRARVTLKKNLEKLRFANHLSP